MRMANAWGSAFALALVVHLIVLALVGQGLLGETALEPQLEYMEVKLVSTPPAGKQARIQDTPVAVASHGQDLIINNKANAVTMPAASSFAAVGEQTSVLPGVATVTADNQVLSISGSSFGRAAGAGEAGSGGTGNGGEASGTEQAVHPQATQEVDRRPSLAYAPPPEYPLEARRNRWQGKVFISALVAASGTATDARVAESSGYDVLDQAAVNVVLNQWRFNPAYRGGRPVPDRVRVPVTFSLNR